MANYSISLLESEIFLRKNFGDCLVLVRSQILTDHLICQGRHHEHTLSHAYQLLTNNVQLLGRFQILSFTESSIARFEH